MVTKGRRGGGMNQEFGISRYKVCTRAKSFQSRSILCNPLDCSPPGSSVHGNSLSKTIGMGCCGLLQDIFLTQGLTSGLLRLLHWQAGSFLAPPGKLKVLYVKQTNKKVLLYSTGNYIQYFVTNYNGKEYEKEYVYMYD